MLYKYCANSGEAMIHYVDELSISEKLRESTRWNDGSFPVSVSELKGNEYVNNCAKWHWHGFVEFIYVMEGSLECCTQKGSRELRPGEGCFINANVLHMNRMAPGCEHVNYRVLHFETDVLTGALSIGSKYVAPLEKCSDAEAVWLRPSEKHERKILDGIGKVYEIAGSSPEQYELHILQNLVSIWTELFIVAEPLIRSGISTSDKAPDRVKEMLSCIHEHYMEKIGIDQIAGAASISRREAFRCFRQVLDTTPTLYLLKYRINRGARMLMENDASVTEVSFSCGFSSPSYFCKAFREITGVSPRQFRKAKGL